MIVLCCVLGLGMPKVHLPMVGTCQLHMPIWSLHQQVEELSLLAIMNKRKNAIENFEIHIVGLWEFQSKFELHLP